MGPLFWTLSEVADLLRVSRWTVWRRCRTGDLPYVVNAAGHWVVTAATYDRLARGLPLRDVA